MPVRSLSPIVQAFVLTMFDPGRQICLRRAVRPQLVRDDDARLTPYFEQFPEKAHRSRLVPAGLDQNVQNIAVGIDSTPEPVFAPLDRHHDLVEMPFVSRERSIPPDLRGKLDTETRNPVSDRFVRNRDAPCRKQVFGITKTESKSMVRPNRIANDRARETKPLQTKQIR